MNMVGQISLPKCAFNSLGTSSEVELLDQNVLRFYLLVMEKKFAILRCGEVIVAYKPFSLNCV